MGDGLREFAGRYAAMSEIELMELAKEYDSLVRPAQDALRAEFDRRSLEPPLLEDPEPIEARDLVTLQSYRDLPAADLARGLLEAAGISAWIQDDNLVRMDWFYSNAIGGIRLKVNRADADVAREMLEQSIPGTFQLDGGEEFAQPRCPGCRSVEVGMESRASKGPPVWNCESCGARWEEADDEPPAEG